MSAIPRERGFFALSACISARLIEASDDVLIGGAQPPEINASDFTATPFDPEEAFSCQ